MIGIMGCLPAMPDEFPVDLRENAGNMIHGNAPFEMFQDVAFYREPRFTVGRTDFSTFVNRECTHLIYTSANSIRLGNPDPVRYIRFKQVLQKFTVPIVIFGLGAQAPRQELGEWELPPEAIDLMKYLGDRTEAIGVRGEFTAAVFEHYAGVTNTFVTGCPSFFSRPHALDELAGALAENRDGRPAYSGTSYWDKHEKRMLVRAIKEDTHLVESANRPLAMYARDLQRGVPGPSLPNFLESHVASGALSQSRVEDYFSSRFHLFRDTRSWYKFNQDSVGFAYGTRFHANMAALLSGVPALWVTHDSRTEEFTSYLKLPAISKSEAAGLSTNELRTLIDYSEMYDALPRLFDRFNQYLALHGLPSIAVPEAASERPSVTVLRDAPPRPKRAGRLVRRAEHVAGALRRRIRKLAPVRAARS